MTWDFSRIIQLFYKDRYSIINKGLMCSGKNAVFYNNDHLTIILFILKLLKS